MKLPSPKLKKWRGIGENIAYNRGYDKPAGFAVERWMKSTSHRKNALNKRWEESGIGVAIGDDGITVYFTQIFLENLFHAIPVLKNNVCVGIITPYDILAFLNSHTLSLSS